MKRRRKRKRKDCSLVSCGSFDWLLNHLGEHESVVAALEGQN